MAIDRSGVSENSNTSPNSDSSDESESADNREVGEKLADEGPVDDPAAVAASRELSEELPVPTAMWPAEIDERARVVEALEDEHRTDERVEPRRDDGELRA
jgi:hypothetical protein